MAESIVTEQVTYPGAGEPVRAYLARPESGQPWPAVIVIQEVFGLTEHIEDIARRFAREGYLALAPDLYSHDPVRPGLSVLDIEHALLISRAPDLETGLEQVRPADRERARQAVEWRANRDTSTYLPDLRAAVDWLKSREDVRGDAIGAIGYCMGGALAGQLAASGAEIAAAVINYGGNPPLDQVPNVRCPVMGHYGGDDEPITPHVPELEAAMKAHGKDFTAYVYEGAPHAFFNDTRQTYTPDAAQLAWERTREFFQRHLKGAKAGVR